MTETPNSTRQDRSHARLGQMLASPAGVLVILPALVIAAGVTVLLLGRTATRETAETMARHQLVAQARAVEIDVQSSLKQAEPVLATMRTLADAAMPTPDALTRLYDSVRGRPGVYNATIAFPIGVTWGAYFDDDGNPRVHESVVGTAGTARVNYRVDDGKLVVIARKTTADDTRTRPYYKAAVEAKKRVWLPPRVFQSSGKTGLTVSEPVYAADGTLQAVMTIDYDVAALSAFLTKAPLEGARSVLFTADGTILASSEATHATSGKHLRKHTDFDDAALHALFETGEVTSLASRELASGEPLFIRLATSDGAYLASVAAVGERTKDSPLTGYLGTLVPESSLLAAMHRLDRTSIIASAVALAIAMGIALVFAWNLLRMRRAVGAARAEARSAEERAKQLGSYRLIERLGLGGMGEVWRAEHQLLARRAAIKLVRNDVATDPGHAAQIQERFKREAQVLASMKSRHTIELYDYGVTDDGTFFYVMELLDGLDLAQLVRAHGPVPAARVIEILAQACQSLAEAHDAGLLHRDVKPANLVLCRAADEVDIVKVLDFGIVQHIAEPLAPVPTRATREAGDSTNRLTVEGSVIGTPGYIAPEQATAAPLDPRGDIYSLACVGWYLLTGTEVFSGATADDVLRAHVHSPTPDLRPLVKGWLPVQLEALIVRCLDKTPDDRPDARELAGALRDIEIPEEHAWTDTHAMLWWSDLRVVPTAQSEAATAVGNLIVAHQAPATTPPAAAPPDRSDAPTLVARPS